MKTKISIMIFLLITFLACESPMAPKISEIIEKPQAQILVSVSPNPIRVSAEFIISLTEQNNVEAKALSASITIYFDGFYDNFIYGSETILPAFGYIDMGDRIILANGKLDIHCKLWVPISSSPDKVLIHIYVLDTNGNEIELYHEMRAIGG